MEDPKSEDKQLCGYAMHHNKCWLLLEKVVGEIEDADLPHLMKTLKMIWSGEHADLLKNAEFNFPFNLPADSTIIPDLHPMIQWYVLPSGGSKSSVGGEPLSQDFPHFIILICGLTICRLGFSSQWDVNLEWRQPVTAPTQNHIYAWERQDPGNSTSLRRESTWMKTYSQNSSMNTSTTATVEPLDTITLIILSSVAMMGSSCPSFVQWGYFTTKIWGVVPASGPITARRRWECGIIMTQATTTS